jgi:hypothetical protein
MKKLFACTLIAISSMGSCKKKSNTSTIVTDPAVPVTVGLKHTLPGLLKESSGLCYTDGNLWSFGDSGNPNSIYKIDTATGAILQTVTIANYSNTDWEDITADSLYIYVGDTGNNDGNRRDLKILRIKKSDLLSAAAQLNVTADAINFSYADQVDFSVNSNTNFDCEALAAVEDSLYLFTKNRGDFKTRCYKLPNNPGTYAVSPVSSFNTAGKITDATYNPATKELALLGYMNEKKGSFIWFFNGYANDNFFAGNAARFTIGTASVEWQTEGLVYISPTRLLMSCEATTSVAASLYFIQKQ